MIETVQSSSCPIFSMKSNWICTSCSRRVSCRRGGRVCCGRGMAVGMSIGRGWQRGHPSVVGGDDHAATPSPLGGWLRAHSYLLWERVVVQPPLSYTSGVGTRPPPTTEGWSLPPIGDGHGRAATPLPQQTLLTFFFINIIADEAFLMTWHLWYGIFNDMGIHHAMWLTWWS